MRKDAREREGEGERPMTDRDEREREKENLKRIKANKRMRSMRKGIDDRQRCQYQNSINTPYVTVQRR